MKQMTRLALSAVVVGLAAGCATRRALPLTSSGDRVHIEVYSDRGDPATLDERQSGYRNEIGRIMEPNLVRRLGDFGFTSAQIDRPEAFKKTPGSYLLKVGITAYNPGSAAARYTVGFGAGACSLDCSYELIDAEGRSILKWDDGIGTSGHWSRLPVALNRRAGDKIWRHFTSGGGHSPQ